MARKDFSLDPTAELIEVSSRSKVRSIIECAVTCIESNEECQAYSYSKLTNMCETSAHPSVVGSSSSLEPSTKVYTLKNTGISFFVQNKKCIHSRRRICRTRGGRGRFGRNC